MPKKNKKKKNNKKQTSKLSKLFWGRVVFCLSKKSKAGKGLSKKGRRKKSKSPMKEKVALIFSAIFGSKDLKNLFKTNKKNNSLQKNDFLTVFNSPFLFSQQEKFDFEKYIEGYKYRKDILGSFYYISKIVDFYSQILRKVARKFLQKMLVFGYRGLIIAIACGLVYISTPRSLGAPESVSVTTKTQWEQGETIGLSTTSSTDALQLASDGTWTARSWSPAPDTISFGSTSVLAGNYLYVARGYSDNDLYVYNIELNQWEDTIELPQPAHYGCDAAYDGTGNIYFVFGGYSKKFYKYNIEDDQWTELPELLDTVYTGASIEFDGEDLFIIRGQASTDFWKFDISQNNWYNLAPAPSAVYTGSNMVYGEDGYMYVTRGYNSVTFWRYDIEQNTWITRTNAPLAFNGEQKGVFHDGYVYFFRSTATATFYRYNVSGNSWETLDVAPATVSDGSLVFNEEDENIYAIRATGQYALWKFDPDADANGEWVGPADVSGTVNTGGDLVWNGVSGAGGYVYAVRGDSANSFYRYNIAANSWSSLGNLPATMAYDTKGAYFNGYLYIHRGDNTTTNFYRYDVGANTWGTRAAAPATVGIGSSAAYLNQGGTDYIFMTRGNALNGFYRYDINANTWATMANIATADGTNYYCYYGCRLESDGTDLYLIPGDGETAFLKYNTASNSWSDLARTPFAQRLGTDITYRLGKLYALAGDFKDETWEYDIAGNSWRKLPSNQRYIYGRGPSGGASIVFAGGDSFYASPGNDITDFWSFTLGSANFVLSGSYISEPIDLSHVQSWVSLTGTENKPANTSISYQTRTSDDQENWSEWENLQGTDIQSPKKRYIQVKIILASTDGLSTPTLSDYTISYNSEDIAPSNPDSITASSAQVGGESLISGTPYKHAHPYFSWNGAEDEDSGIEGYYVYFGTDDDANPQDEGVFQTSDSFVANIAMDEDEYFLRIKTKDNDGNISEEAWPAFVYNYQGVSPFQSVSKTAQADFENGTLENISASSDPDELQLEGAGGFWDEVRLSNAPATIRYGAELALADGDVYALRGNNQLNFYFYDVSENVWSSLANTLETVNYGGALVEGPEGYLYASRGYNTSTFWRYNIESNLWEAMASAPKNFTYGSSLSFDGSRYIFALPGNDDAFYRYDTQNNQWTTLPNAEFGNPNETDGQATNRGSDSAYDGTNAIYVMQGNYYNYFSKYTIADNSQRGESANEWAVLKPLPIGSYAGGCLSYDPQTNAVYALTGNLRQNFFKYDIATNEWSQMPNIPAATEYGASLATQDGYVYALRGYNSASFYRFNIEEQSWDSPSQGFFGPNTEAGGTYFGYYYGTEVEQDNTGKVYITKGNYSDDFGVYDTNTGSFTLLARAPVGIYNGATMVFNEDENAIYLTSGDLRTRRSGTVNNYFMKYDIAANAWQIISTDPVPLQTNYGSSMVYDGSRYIYLTRGGGANTWWRYDTTATAGSRWSAALSTIANWTHGYGSNMIFKEDGSGKFIYSCRGDNSNICFRYDTEAGTWFQLSNALAAVRYGGSLMDGNDGYLYLTAGNNTNGFFRYHITNNSWETISNVPAQIYQGGAGAFASHRVWTTAGNGTNSYADGLYNYLVASSQNNIGYEKRGSYISETIDLIDVYRWANLEVSLEEPQNTSISIQTRTSANSSDWSSWSDVVQEEDLGSNLYRFGIQSSADRYIQIKIEFFSSDQIYSPRVYDYTVNYYQDLMAPSNPSSVEAYESISMAEVLDPNDWHRHQSPHFVWPVAETAGGASDGSGGSGVIGYYVCFGNAVDCVDPYTDGAFQTGNSYTASGVVSGQEHRLLIKAVDDAQMIPSESFDAFSYKFDNEPPSNPSDIIVDPAGYTASDQYEFMWEANATDINSGLAKLQYRTGGDAEDAWTDIANSGSISISLPNAEHPVGAYKSGKNWFYIRAVDNAGNVSSPLSQEYYFSMDAPSPPKNIQVIPPYSETNAFSFSWEQPDSFMGNSEELSYHYSVNALPNAFNTTETSLTWAGPGPFATQKGSNRFYVCAMDEAGNIDYSLYAYADFTADTSAPGAPVNLQIFDTSDRESQEYSIALKWSPPVSMNEDNFDGYVIFRSDDNVNFTEVATTSGSAYVDSELESKLYYYYAKSKDSTNNISVPSSTVNIIPTGRYTTPPTLVTEPSSTTQSFAATVTWATNRVASSFVEYGTAMSLGKTNGQVDSVTAHTVELTGLNAGTKYFYRAKFIDPDGNIGTSDISTFETLPPPTISEVVVSGIGLNSATVSWKTNTDATCVLKYGEGSFTGSIEEASSGTGHVSRIEGLNSSTAYKIQIDAIDKDLNTFSSDEYTFQTLEQPVTSDFSLENKENVDLPTLVVKYKTSIATTTLVKFKTASESSYHNYLTNEYATEHQAEISGLEPSIEYEIVATGVDANGVEAIPSQAKITTRADSRAPGILINRAVGKVVGRGKDSRANMYIKIETDEVTTAQVFYSNGIVLNNFEQNSNLDSLNTYHLITIPVDPGQVYSYIVKIQDESQNETVSKPVTVVVEGSKDSASEIVVNTFANKFSWITRLWKK